MKFIKKHYLICLVISALIIIRIPPLVFWGDYMTGHDAAIYMEKSINVAEGKGFISSICRHISDREDLVNYTNKFGTQIQEIKVAPLYIYTISILYKLFGIDHFMMSINIFNLLLFVLISGILYLFVLRKYPDNITVQIGTILIFGLNFMMYWMSYGAHMEIFSLFIFVVVFMYHLYIIDLRRPSFSQLIFYSIALTLLFLSKYSAIPFVGAFVLHHLYQNKYRQFIMISIFVFIGAGSWFFLRDIMMDGRVIGNFGMSFPFDDTENGIFSLPYHRIPIIIVSVMLFFVQRILDMFAGYIGLAFLFPFAIISMYDFKKHNYKQAVLFIIVITIMFYLILGSIGIQTPRPRYIYPALVLVIPPALYELDKLLKTFKNNIGRTILYIFLSLYVIYNITDMVNFTYDVQRKSIDRASIFKAAGELIEEEKVSNDKNIMTNIIGYNVYSDRGVVLTPVNIDYQNKYKILQTYNIDYVLFASDQNIHWASWNQNLVPTNIFSDLQLVDISAIDGRVKLYSTKIWK